MSLRSGDFGGSVRIKSLKILTQKYKRNAYEKDINTRHVVCNDNGNVVVRAGIDIVAYR